MKTCIAKNCENDVFSHSYCRLHQWMRTDDKYKKYKENKKRGKIPKKSKKREADEIHYKDHCKELEQEYRLKNDGKIYCFFSGKEIKGRVTWHHWYGRSGHWYTDKNGLVPCINEYHLMYHHLSTDKFEEQVDYGAFLERLKIFDEHLYNKQIGKKEKVHKLNPTLFDDEED